MITSCLFCEKLLISTDIICIIEVQLIDLGGIAQLVERLNGIQEVRGSTPLISTTRYPVEPFCKRQRVLAGYFIV